jgi:hypothetical protein
MTLTPRTMIWTHPTLGTFNPERELRDPSPTHDALVAELAQRSGVSPSEVEHRDFDRFGLPDGSEWTWVEAR